MLANRVIRASYYETDNHEGVEFTELEKELQWGADAVPAMLELFRVEPAPGDGGFVGFVRHWRGGTIGLAVECIDTPDESTRPSS